MGHTQVPAQRNLQRELTHTLNHRAFLWLISRHAAYVALTHVPPLRSRAGLKFTEATRILSWQVQELSITINEARPGTPTISGVDENRQECNSRPWTRPIRPWTRPTSVPSAGLSAGLLGQIVHWNRCGLHSTQEAVAYCLWEVHGRVSTPSCEILVSSSMCLSLFNKPSMAMQTW